MSNQSEYVHTGDAAALIKVSKSYLNKARVTGSGPPYVKIGKAVRYHIPTVREWVNARMLHSTSETNKAS